MPRPLETLYRILDSDALWWPNAHLRPAPEVIWTREHTRQMLRDRRWRLGQALLVLIILVNTLAIAATVEISAMAAFWLFLAQAAGVAVFVLTASWLTRVAWNHRARRLQRLAGQRAG